MIDKTNLAERELEKRRTNPSAQWKRVLFFWVVFFALIALILITIGAHLGANGPDRWYTRLVIWFAGLL